MIPFNRPHFTGKESEYIQQAMNSGKISGDGIFTKKCHQFFEQRYSFKKVFLTTSCTDALEMASILIDIQPGDEVISPSYTFVSTVNAFVLRGAKVIFVDSSVENPNMDANKIEGLITSKTKAIITVHYAGIACDMTKIMDLANKYNLFVVEDAAHSVDSFYNGKPLGSIGHLSTFSFHETKNIISGEGGMIVINDERFSKRAEIIREKGTNRSAFFRGEVDKYGWVDIGSSFLPSDLIAAFLFAQVENIDDIQQKRKKIWNTYRNALLPLEEEGKIKLPFLPDYATNNAHMFYIVCDSLEEREKLIHHMKANDIYPAFHYLSLHKSQFYKDKHDGRELPLSDRYADCLLRLPFYYDLKDEDINKVVNSITNFYKNKVQNLLLSR